MNQKEYDELEKSFNSYYEAYKRPSNDVLLKYEHSFHVADYMEELAKRMALKEEDIYLAKAIGLLHDIGRFEQLKQFDSFDDKLFDHADFAVVYLFEEGHIRDFIKKKKNDHIIKEAILNHNKYQIREGLTKKELLFSKMIRDMDKVDIYYQVGMKYRTAFKDKPSKKVIDIFYNGKSIPSEEVKNKSDRVIQFIAFLNDFNYKESFEILKESDNFGFYISSVEVSDENIEAFHQIINSCELLLR